LTVKAGETTKDGAPAKGPGGRPTAEQAEQERAEAAAKENAERIEKMMLTYGPRAMSEIGEYLADKRGSHWRFSAAESQALWEAFFPVLNKWTSIASIKFGAELGFLVAAGFVAYPRGRIDRQLAKEAEVVEAAKGALARGDNPGQVAQKMMALGVRPEVVKDVVGSLHSAPPPPDEPAKPRRKKAGRKKAAKKKASKKKKA